MMIDLEKLKALEKAATPGPWELHSQGKRVPSAFFGVLQSTARGAILEFPNEVDGDFICAVRNALPDILALLEEARELLNPIHDHGLTVEWVRLRRAFLSKFETKREG